MKDCRITNDLIAVQNDRVVQVFTRNIEGRNIIALSVPWIFYQSNAAVLLCPFIELLFAVSDHDVDLMDSILVKCRDDRIYHVHTIDCDQRFRRCQGHRAQPLTDTRSHNDRTFYNMFRHNLCQMPLCILGRISRCILLRSLIDGVDEHRALHRNDA